LYSTVTGQKGELDLDARYWARNLREPVLFSLAVERLVADGHAIFLELSPHPILLPAVQQTLGHLVKEGTVLRSLRRGEGEQAASIGEAHLQREVARVLGLPPSRLDVSQPLNTLGIDSLMALELKKQIESELQVEVPLIKVIQGPSVAELAGLLLSLLAGVDVLTEAPATPQPPPRVTGESLLLSLLSLREDERSG